jgi:hypothetical protein
MIYVDKFILPSQMQEIQFIQNEDRTCFGTFYPFKIFADKGLRAVNFDAITIFYGGNDLAGSRHHHGPGAASHRCEIKTVFVDCGHLKNAVFY